MIQIKGKTANELFIKTAKEMLNNGNYSSPRGLKTIELENVWLELENPRFNLVNLPARNISTDYLDGEMKWYLSGSTKVSDIEKHSRFWSKLADSNGTVNSNYGYLTMIEKFAGKSQLEWCIDKLKNDNNTRQAVINYNQPKHKYPNNKDFVCTLNQLFRLNNNKLDSTVMMRSNDLIYGLTYDLPWFTLLQRRIASGIDKDIGKYNHFAASLHVYEKHFKMLENIANSKQEDFNELLQKERELKI